MVLLQSIVPSNPGEIATDVSQAQRQALPRCCILSDPCASDAYLAWNLSVRRPASFRIPGMKLVISNDSALAHLAELWPSRSGNCCHTPPTEDGLRNREDSPWCTSIRLFRQDCLGTPGSNVSVSHGVNSFRSLTKAIQSRRGVNRWHGLGQDECNRHHSRDC